jgi:pimeloyl-ACP methyl ester carboxylesterase
MKRLLQALLLFVAAVILLPPLWFLAFPADPPPELPPAGTRVELSRGVALNVLERGSGPAVVMVHGLPGSGYDWRALSPELAKRGRRAIAYDRVGYGRSDPRPDERYTLAANTAELIALLEALDLRDVTVVGWSYGGVMTMLATMGDPAPTSRIGRIVLVGTGGPDSPDAQRPELPLAMAIMNSKPVLRWRVAVPVTGVTLMKALSEIAFSGQPQPDWWLAGLRGNFARWETLMAYRGEMSGVPGPGEDDAEFSAQMIAVPTLILHGDNDQLASIAIGRYLHSLIPNSNLFEYPGGSHMLPVTHAADVADRIAAFSAPSR